MRGKVTSPPTRLQPGFHSGVCLDAPPTLQPQAGRWKCVWALQHPAFGLKRAHPRDTPQELRALLPALLPHPKTPSPTQKASEPLPHCRHTHALAASAWLHPERGPSPHVPPSPAATPPVSLQTNTTGASSPGASRWKDRATSMSSFSTHPRRSLSVFSNQVPTWRGPQGKTTGWDRVDHVQGRASRVDPACTGP